MSRLLIRVGTSVGKDKQSSFHIKQTATDLDNIQALYLVVELCVFRTTETSNSPTVLL